MPLESVSPHSWSTALPPHLQGVFTGDIMPMLGIPLIVILILRLRLKAILGKIALPRLRSVETQERAL